jgi:hypothetical protein
MATIAVTVFMKRGAATMKATMSLTPGNLESLQEHLAAENWQWQRRDEAQPSHYILFDYDGAHDAPLPLRTALTDGGKYLVKIAKKPEQPIEKPSEATKRGRPLLELPAWMEGTITSISEYEAGEKLLHRLSQQASKARKAGDGEEQNKWETLQASCRERMRDYKKNNAESFHDRAMADKLDLQAALNRFSVRMGKKIDRIAKGADDEEEDADENPKRQHTNK